MTATATFVRVVRKLSLPEPFAAGVLKSSATLVLLLELNTNPSLPQDKCLHQRRIKAWKVVTDRVQVVILNIEAVAISLVGLQRVWNRSYSMGYGSNWFKGYDFSLALNVDLL